jgi:hypothetical protein
MYIRTILKIRVNYTESVHVNETVVFEIVKQKCNRVRFPLFIYTLQVFDYLIRGAVTSQMYHKI